MLGAVPVAAGEAAVVVVVTAGVAAAGVWARKRKVGAGVIRREATMRRSVTESKIF